MSRRRSTIGRREFLRISGMASAGALVAACAPSTAPSAAPAAPKTDTSRLVVGIGNLGQQRWSPWLGMDPGESQILHHIGETLLRNNSQTLALEGHLAESWSVSPDGRTWSFKLRPNIPFQDGYGTVTAEDVRFSWEQFIRSDSTFGQVAATNRQAVDGDIKNFEIVGPLEFKVHTTKPTPFLATNLSTITPGMVVQSKRYWQEQPARAPLHPLGTGPFKFVSSAPGLEVQLEAVPNHWYKTPAFKAVTFRLITDDASRLAQVRSGTVDLAPLPPALALEAKKVGINILSIKQIGTMSVMLGGQFPGDPTRPAAYDRNSPWIQADNLERGLAVRQAMSLAIDRKLIIEKVMAGEGTLIYGPIVQFPTNSQLADPSWKLPGYDAAQAKQLLARGGYPNGFDVTMMVYENRAGAGGASVAEAVSGMWEAIGLKVKRQPSDQTAFRPTLMARASAGMAYPYITPYFEEAVTAFQSVYQTTSTSAIFYDPAITAAIPRWLAEPDQAKRYAITREVLSSLIASVRAIPLFTINQSYGASDKVGGWTPLSGQSELTGLETITPKS